MNINEGVGSAYTSNDAPMGGMKASGQAIATASTACSNTPNYKPSQANTSWVSTRFPAYRLEPTPPCSPTPTD